MHKLEQVILRETGVKAFETLRKLGNQNSQVLEGMCPLHFRAWWQHEQ